MPTLDANWGTRGLEKLRQAALYAANSGQRSPLMGSDAQLEQAGAKYLDSVDPSDLVTISESFDNQPDHTEQLRKFAQQRAVKR